MLASRPRVHATDRFLPRPDHSACERVLIGLLQHTFNMLLPLLDLDLFMDSIVTRVLREGYRNDDLESVVALLVFALGQLAIEGVTGRPAGGSKDDASGFRGGTIEKPPGLGLFNEARRRIGMINMQPCLENV